MGRPTRSWIRKTYTVSEMVEKAIAMRAAESGIDPGTVVDILVWEALLKPDEARHKAGGFNADELERMFAEEALAHLDEGAVEDLACYITLSSNPDDDDGNLRLVKRLVKRWRKTRLIEKDHQEAVFSVLNGRGFTPSLIEHRHVDLGWFQPE